MKTLKLTRNLEAIVDDSDFERFSQFKWYAQRGYGGTFYAAHRTAGKRNSKVLLLHREIMGATTDQYVDHRNGNTLDNRRGNLRVCTNAENGRNRVRKNKNNTSGFKGVFWHKAAGKWMAQIKGDFKCVYLGLFDSNALAAKAYDSAAIRLHGEFASLNFPKNLEAASV